MRSPSDQEQIDVFYAIMHAANLMQITFKRAHFKDIVEAMNHWSYAHRSGNGEITDDEQQSRINAAFWALQKVVNRENG